MADPIERSESKSAEELRRSVAAATRARRGHDLPHLDEAVIRTLPADADAVSLFVERAVAAGVTVTPCASAEVATIVRERAGTCGDALIEPACMDRYPGLQGLGVSAPDDEQLFAAGCGVTLCDFGIAETGSLVVVSGAGRWRQFSIAPAVHIGILRRSDIVLDLLDVLRASRGSALPANLVVVTGPSRTADIAQRIVQGVHGPLRLECLLVEAS